jgi:hypothetical protein
MIDEIATQVARGECILFLGAGVHYPPPEPSEGSPARYLYPDAERPPLGRALAERLAAKCQLLTDYPYEAANLGNLQRVAMFFERKLGRQALVDEIVAAVDREPDVGGLRQTRPSPAVKALAELPFSMVITTNYDHLFENALLRAGKEPQRRIYQREGVQPTKDWRRPPETSRPYLFKLHGDIEDPSSIVITDEDYIQFVLRMSDRDSFHPVPETFRVQFKRWPTLFIGYSLIDYNLRLLFRTLRWKLDPADYPKAYSVDLRPDPLIEHFYGAGQNRYVWFLVENVWSFVPQLYLQIMGKEMPTI